MRGFAIRLEAELSSSGFRASDRTLSDDGAPRDLLEAALADEVAEALVLLRERSDGLPEAGLIGIDAWIAQRGCGLVRHERLSAALHSTEAARVLAVEVSDLLRARLVVAQPACPVLPVHEQVASAAVPEPAAQTSHHFGLGAGALLLLRPHLWVPSVMPDLAFGYRESHAARAGQAQFIARLSLSASGPSITRGAEQGSLSARQGLGLIEAGVRFDVSSHLSPELSAGLGVYGVGVRGRTEAPYVAHDEVSYSVLSSARVGADVLVLSPVSLRLSAFVGYASNKTSLRVAERELLRTGGMMCAVALELWLWL